MAFSRLFAEAEKEREREAAKNKTATNTNTTKKQTTQTATQQRVTSRLAQEARKEQEAAQSASSRPSSTTSRNATANLGDTMGRVQNSVVSRNATQNQTTKRSYADMQAEIDSLTNQKQTLLKERGKLLNNRTYGTDRTAQLKDVSAQINALDQQLNALKKEAAAHEDHKSALERVGSGVGSIGMSLAATVPLLAETAAQAVKNAATGGNEGLDDDSLGMRWMEKANEMRQDATEGLSGVGAFLGDTAISIGQNAALLPTAVINPAIPFVAMGAQAGAQKAYEVQEDGGGAGEALGRGIISGGIEAITEKIPLDNLLDIIKAGGKGAIKNILKQAGVEATEEGISYTANYIADKAVGDPNAQFSVQELLESAAAGGLSGMFFGGAGTAVHHVQDSKIGANYQAAAEDLVNEGLSFAPETEAYQTAQEVKAKMDAGLRVSDAELGRVVVANERAIQAEEQASALELAAEAVEAEQQAVNKPQSDVSRAAEQTATQTRNASRAAYNPSYGERGTQAFQSIVERSGMEPERVRQRFQSAYEAGLTELPRERVQLLDSIQEEAYTAGREDHILNLAKQEKPATVYGKESGFIQSDAAKGVDVNFTETLNTVSKALGMKTMFEEQVYGGRANGSYSDGVLRIARDAESPYVVVAKHEITHRMQELAPAQYTQYRDYAVQILSEGRSGTTLVEAYQDRAANAGVRLTTEDAMDEIAADFTERILTDEKALHDFVNHTSQDQQTRTMGQKFFQAVREFIDKVKRIFKGDRKKMDQAAMDEFGATVAQLEKAEKLWKQAYRAAEQNVKDTGEQQSRMVVETQAASIKDQAMEFSDLLTKFSLRKKDPPKKVGIAYKVFYAKDGQLYPPMVANPGGAGTPVGVWLDADVGVSAPPSKTGRPQVQAGGKGTNASKGSLAFRPGWHLGDLPMATQFARKNPETGKKELFPADFVWAECEYAMDHDYQEEAMSYGYTENGKFRHSYAGLPRLPEDGYYRYRTNPNPDTVPWVITGAMRVKRILTDAETDQILRDAGVEPMKRQGGPIDLEKLGLKAGDTSGGKKFSLKIDTEGLPHDVEQEAKDVVNTLKRDKMMSRYGSRRYASYTSSRIDTELAESMVEGIADYAHSYIAWIDPLDFLYATTRYASDRERIRSEAGELRLDELRANEEPIYLIVNEKNGEIVGHEGRHRMTALMDSGIDRVAVIVRVTDREMLVGVHGDKYNGKLLWPRQNWRLKGQEFGSVRGANFTLRNLLPLSERYADAARQLFSETDGSVKFSLKSDGDKEIVSTKSGETVAETHKDGTTMFSLKTYQEDGRAYLDEWLTKRVNSKHITRAEADDIVQQMDEFYDLCQKFTDKYGTFGAWSNAEVVKDSKGKPVFSVVKANGEYAMNLDFSLVCKKRRTLDAVFREMINRDMMNDVDLGEAEIAKINGIIRESGFETACALCFVDSKRYRQAMVADSFVRQYNDMVDLLIPDGSDIQAHKFDFMGRGAKGGGRALHTVPDAELGKGILKLKKVMQENGKLTVAHKIAKHLLNTPQDRKHVTRSEFMNTDGFEAVTLKNKKVLGLYNSSKGSGGPKASLSDVQYLGEILKKNNFTPARAYAVGGVRIQSFSDYIPRLVFDYLQMIADLSAKGLPAHAYTKEEMFALQFGMTGIKVNMSLVPAIDPKGIAPGLDAKGNYVWFDGQSFGSDVNVKGSGNTGFKRAVEIQNAAGYSGNCGTIAVGVSDEHIWKMLDDDDIRMIIPYHKSSLNHIVAVMNNIDQYEDYTGVQNTRFAETGKKIDRKDFNFNDALRRTGDAKAAADEYLAWCEEHDYLPKFDTFADHENYYKLLEDFSTYDNGEAAPQGPVKMKFPGKDAAFGSMAQLIERGLEEDAILEGRRTASVPQIVDKIEAVYNGAKMKFSLKEQNDLLRQNAKLKEVNQELREQFKTTEFAKVDKKSLDQFTKKLLRDYSSGADINETRTELDDLYTYLANGEDGQNPGWNEAYKRAYEVAVSILESATVVDDQMYRDYKALRERLRTVGITLDRQYSHDLIGYENLEDFRKRNFGRLKIVKDGLPVDVLYQDLADTYPELFDAYNYTTQGDQLTHIAEVLDMLQPVEVNPYSHNMRESATWLANDIMERFFELPQAKPTFADKAEQKLTKQVIKDAKKLERVREQKNQRIAEIIAENREKVKNAVTGERMAAGREVAKLKKKYAEKEAKASESKKASILRAKIIRHTNKLKHDLLANSDKHHVPKDMRLPVELLLDSINLESQYEYVFGKDGKYHRVEAGTELGAEPTKRTEAFRELRKVYKNLMETDASDVVIDPDMLEILERVIDLSDIPIAAMNSTQLDAIWQAVRGIEHAVRTAGKVLSKAKYERTSEWAHAIVDDTATRRRMKIKSSEAFRIDLENPYTFFSHYGESGKAIFRMLRDAQDRQQEMVEQVQAEVAEIVDPKTVRKWEREMHEFTTERGVELKLTAAQCMEIHELMKREQARDHLMKGGIVQPEIEHKRIKRGTDAILLTEGDLAQIVGVLTNEQVEVADKLQKLTTTTLADFGNEASMKAYGYEKFTGSDYWPIKSAKEAIHSNIEKGGSNTRSIKNIGLAKSVIPHASNPLDIGGVFKTFASHAGDMTDYAAWLCPMEDANRLYNFQFRDELGQQTGKTVKGLLDRVGGKGAQQYWHNLMEDIQNGLTPANDSAFLGPINKVIGNVKGASVGANLRVIVQQPTAILRAAMVLNPADMTAGLVSGGGWKKALEHSSIAKRKAMGGFDISSPMQMQEILFDSKKGLQRFNEAMMAPAGAADALTWGRIWNACEWATKRKHKDLKKGSAEFYEETARLFTEVIDQTQVVDGVLQRSQTMRSGNALLKQATSFMGEPTMAMNMLLRAYDGLRNETNVKRRGKAIKTFGRAAMVLLVTNAVNALAQSLVDAVRDDEDEKDYWERFWAAFTGVTGEEESAWEKAYAAVLGGNLGASLNPVGYVPVAKDVLSILQGYNVTRADADVMGDIITASQTFLDSVSGDGKKTIPYATKNLAQQIGKAFGVSAPNILRDVWGIARSIAIETDNAAVMYEMEKAIYKVSNEKNAAQFVAILYRAYETDKDVYEHIYNDLISVGINPETIKNKMEGQMKKAQGVSKVSELEQRYLNPSQQPEWDNTMSSIRKSGLWKDATEKQRDELESKLYNLVTDSKSGEEMQEKIREGAAYGLDESEYMLYQLALDMYDQPNESGEYGGTATSEEKAIAIAALGSLNDGEIAFLWDTEQGYELHDSGIDMRAFVDYVGTGGSVNTEKLIDVHSKGIEEEVYFDFLDMLKEVDQPTESGRMGSFTQDEATAAVAAIPGLTRAERAVLWQSVNKSWKSKNNPWG